MPVDLGDLVDSLKREVSPPGTDLFPNATEDEYTGHLADAFWEARLQGMLDGFTEVNGRVQPQTAGEPDMTRDLQQLIVLYAGYRILLSSLMNLQTVFRAQSGPNSFETQRSAQVVQAVLRAVKEKINIVLGRLSDVGGVNVAVFDAVIERTFEISTGEQWWVRG